MSCCLRGIRFNSPDSVKNRRKQSPPVTSSSEKFRNAVRCSHCHTSVYTPRVGNPYSHVIIRVCLGELFLRFIDALQVKKSPCATTPSNPRTSVQALPPSPPYHLTPTGHSEYRGGMASILSSLSSLVEGRDENQCRVSSFATTNALSLSGARCRA